MASEESATISLTLAPTAPSRHQWHKADLGKLFPDSANKAVEALADFNRISANVLEGIKTGLEIAKVLAALASINPLEESLRQALQQIEDFIDGLLGNTSVHAIMIPIQKQFFGYGDPIPPSSLDPLAIVPDYDQLVTLDAYPKALLKTNTPDTISFINTASTALGGNAGFYKELVISTYDVADLARPTFPSTYAVTGVAIIFGSAHLTDIYRLATLFNRIFKLAVNTNLASRTLPAATGLTAKICPIPSKNRIGVVLTWDPVPLVVLKPLFTGDALVITELIVVRSTDANFRQRWSWQQNFLREPTNDLQDLQGNLETSTVKVIARLTNGTSNWVSATGNTLFTRNSYTDDDPNLKVNTSYYYGLYLRTKINGTVQPIGLCSNVVWVYYTPNIQTSRLSQPPDWFATPTLYQLFPILQDVVNTIKLLIHKYLTRTTSNSGLLNMIEQSIAMVERLIQEAEKYAALFEELEALLKDLVNADTGGMYVTNFDVSTGGTTGWTSELGRRLSNKSDTSRPPFDNGELTAGFVLLAGRPNLPQLSGIRSLFNLLFGKGDTNVFKDVTAAFDTSNAITATKPTFGTDMSTMRTALLPADSVAALTSQPKPVFDKNMNASTTLDDC